MQGRSNMPEFETEAEARAEDLTRVQLMSQALLRPMKVGKKPGPTRKAYLRKQVTAVAEPSLDRRLIKDLRGRLDVGAQADTPEKTLASSVWMRDFRLHLVDALSEFADQFECSDLRALTVLNEQWQVAPDDLQALPASKIVGQFRTHLNRAGVLELPGPFIAILHGEFEPTQGVYVLHFHGLTTEAKARQAKAGLKASWGYVPTATGGPAVKRQQVRNGPSQFSYLAQAFWPQRAIRDVDGTRKRDRTKSRIPEPFGTQVLLWLDRHKFEELVLMNDVWSPKRGGSAPGRQLYLRVRGRQ